MGKTLLKSFYIIAILVNGVVAQAQLLINEICSANQSIITDEEFDTEDFVEIFNAGTDPINLHDYYMTDDNQQPHKWRFPTVTLAPQTPLLFFASGDYVADEGAEDHWETVLYSGDSWNYFVGNSEPDATWNQSGYDDSSWLEGVGGFGYGDDDDATAIPQCFSVYLRKTFDINDIDNIARCIFNLDYDDGFVAYLNGVEIAREFVGVPGQFTPYDALATGHEATMYLGGVPEYFFLEEAVVNNLLVEGENVLCIQIHNSDFNSSDFSAIPFFSVGVTDNSFNYGTPPAWFGLSQTTSLHTSFSLAPVGETLFIFDENYNIVDQKIISQLQPNHAHARIPDGSVWCITTSPTPNTSNNASDCQAGYVPAPTFNPDGAFFSGPQWVGIVQNEPNTFTTYSINGDEPTETSTLYTEPLVIGQNTVIRARSFSNDDLLASQTATSTFFISEDTSIPVVSLTMDTYDLWDWDNGIYVSGPNADNANFPFYGSNFWNDWERKGHVEYYDKNQNFGFELDAGVKLHGNWSKGFPQKSFRVLTRDEYGASKINYQLFPDKNITTTDAFNIRNSGIDWNTAHMRDALSQKVALKTHIDIQNARHCLMFLNGDYFGVFDLRERIDVDFISENHPQIDPDDIDLMAFDWNVLAGSGDDFSAMVGFITGNDMSTQANYEVAKDWLDIENFCDYFIAETFYVNADWLGWYTNNIKFWRPNNPGGKWRYILWDTDLGLGLGNWANFDELGWIMNPGTYNPHSDMLNSLVENTEFHNHFINRYADLVNTIYSAENFIQLANDLRDTVYTEMPRHFEQWGISNTNPYGWGTSLDMDSWNANYQNMLNFLDARPAYARDHVQNFFGLPEQVDVTLNVQPAGAGYIQISTIVPDEYPWQGVYFDGVPVKLTAIANPGYSFDHWLSEELITSPDENQNTTLVISTDDAFMAFFNGSPTNATVTISEINYHSDDSRDAGDWVELYNYGNDEMDISEWTFKDDIDASHFVFPVPTILQPLERLVICFDSTLFSEQHPGVANFSGNMNFNLDNGGENLRLYNREDEMVVMIAYDDTLTWPKAADGHGRTLELSNPLGNLSNGTNWFAGCMGGSPGEAFSPCNESIVFSEVNYNSAPWLDSGDWVELRNVSNQSVDLNGWSFRDDDNAHCYELDFVLNAGENIVLAENMSLFSTQNPDVSNVNGPIGFAFDNDSEALRLYNAQGEIFSSLVYHDYLPWPQEVDGMERTLELLDSSVGVNNASNWFAGCPGGSPGEFFTPCEILVDELDGANIFIYPNPANDKLNIRFENSSNGWHVALLDMMGNEVMRSNDVVVSEISIDISSLAKGVYALQVRNAHEPVLRMVVKQ